MSIYTPENCGTQPNQVILTYNGWSAVCAVVASDGVTEVAENDADPTQKRILKFIEWIGGTGTEPDQPATPNFYIGATGFVSIGNAINIRGGQGSVGNDGNDGNDGADGANAYVYIAYADADDGTGFTNTFDASKDYIAILSTDTEIPSPVVGDFAGLWKRYAGVTSDIPLALITLTIPPSTAAPISVAHGIANASTGQRVRIVDAIVHDSSTSESSLVPRPSVTIDDTNVNFPAGVSTNADQTGIVTIFYEV